MATKGWIKYYRSTMQSVVWSDPFLLKMFNYCLLKARHEAGKTIFNGQEIFLNSGQFVTGRDALHDAYNRGAKKRHQISSSSTFRLLKKLEEYEILNIKSNTKYSVVTVVNWNRYQNSEQQIDNKPTTNRQQTDTNKNDKNAENAKKKNSPKNRRTYSDDSQEFILASYLLERIKVNNPDVKEPDLQKWADGIRLMIERDKREPEKIRKMIDWSQSNDFWSGNVLSVVKLRKHFDQMATQANKEYKAHHRNPPTEHMNLDSVEDF